MSHVVESVPSSFEAEQKVCIKLLNNLPLINLLLNYELVIYVCIFCGHILVCLVEV